MLTRYNELFDICIAHTAQAEPFPELEKVLVWCLETEREKRCQDLSSAIKELEKVIVQV